MALLLGILFAVSIGSGDFLSGIAARRVRTSVVVTYSQVWGLAALMVYIAASDRTVPPAWDHVLGVFAGFGLVTGICCLVRGLAIGRMSVVAPTAAALGAAVGVVYGFIIGERPGVVAVVGVALALRPNLRNPMSDDRISQGLIGLLVNAGADQSPRVTEILNEAGAVDVATR